MVELTKENFDELVLQNNKIVLVDFFSDGCEPCKALAPKIEELEEVYKEKITFFKFNITNGRRLAIREKVLGLPTVAIYIDGKKKSEVTKEEATKENVEKLIKELL